MTLSAQTPPTNEIVLNAFAFDDIQTNDFRSIMNVSEKISNEKIINHIKIGLIEMAEVDAKITNPTASQKELYKNALYFRVHADLLISEQNTSTKERDLSLEDRKEQASQLIQRASEFINHLLGNQNVVIEVY